MLQIFNFNNLPINFGKNVPQITFVGKPVINFNNVAHEVDSFVSNPLNDKFGNAAQIKASAMSNPAITSLLDRHNIPLVVNEKELENLKNGHLKDSRMLAVNMYTALPDNLKQEVNLRDLQEAAMFHDYGKVLIPDKILNKKGALNEDEWEIMKLHSELGYELLKDKGLSDRTLSLIKYHHQTADSCGYPAIDNIFYEGLDSQLLRAADEYSALTEVRSYKPAMSRNEALAKIREDAYISNEVFEALEKSV